MICERPIDPFGALEFFCTNAIFKLAAPGIVRVLMTCREQDGQPIIKVKLLLPFESMPSYIASATAFSAGVIAREVNGAAPLTLM